MNTQNSSSGGATGLACRFQYVQTTMQRLQEMLPERTHIFGANCTNSRRVVASVRLFCHVRKIAVEVERRQQLLQVRRLCARLSRRNTICVTARRPAR